MICEHCGHEQDDDDEDPYEVEIGPLTEAETRWLESDQAKYLAAKLIERSNLPLVTKMVMG